MIVLFNKQLYHLQAIKRAIKAYEELAVFNVKEKDNNIEVDISKADKDVKDIIKDEFCNYVLSETKKLK